MIIYTESYERCGSTPRAGIPVAGDGFNHGSHIAVDAAKNDEPLAQKLGLGIKCSNSS